MARVQRTNSARRDLAYIWAYIAYDSPRNADLFLDRIEQTLVRLSDFPGIGTRRDELSKGLRSFPVGNYIIFYREVAEGIIISRVIHGARDLPSQL
jgi:toxin ParE1/3/4